MHGIAGDGEPGAEPSAAGPVTNSIVKENHGAIGARGRGKWFRFGILRERLNMDIRQSVMGVLLAGAIVGVAGCGDSEEVGSPAEPEVTSTTGMAVEAEETSAAPAKPTDDSVSEGPVAAAEEVVITVTYFSYQISGPVAPGAEVTVVNRDSASHTVTSDEEGMFDSVFGPNQTVTFTAPDKPGEYSFICTYHPAMVGTLVVEG